MGTELKLKCRCCKSYHGMNRTAPEGYQGWCYDQMDWLDPSEPQPLLSQETYWRRSETMPKTGEIWKLCVKRPFWESIGNTFWVNYESEYQFFNGFEAAEEVDQAAVVLCRLDSIGEAEAFDAWVTVTVLDVIPYRDLATRFPAYETDQPLESFHSMPCTELDLNAPPWKLVSWGKNETSDSKIIFTDENGLRHLVLHSYYCSMDRMTYFGNITEKQK